LKLALLDGAVGVKDEGGDGVVGAGAPVQERAGSRGDERLGIAENLFEESDFFVVVGGDSAVGKAGGVELAAGVGGDERGYAPECNECDGTLDVDGLRARGWVGVQVGVKVSGEPDGDECGEWSIDRSDVVGKTRLDEAEGCDLDDCEESESSQGAQARLAQGGIEGDGIDQDPGWGGEEKDAEVVPPRGDVAIVLMGDAADDVEVEVLVDEGLAETVEKVEVPGKDKDEEE
jgi:hypothetical protein